ncbi:MAG: hypothetical protein LBH25_14285 [Fibromonadaceae bacterium]|nr:hypothetical protein [Fibromonadaceae bacterium]
MTSDLNPTNSDDLLFPDDKYEYEELFPMGGEERDVFNKICESNLAIFKDIFTKFIETFNLKMLRLFVIEGYDCNIEVKKCTLDDAVQDILQQVQISPMIDSVIYELN